MPLWHEQPIKTGSLSETRWNLWPVDWTVVGYNLALAILWMFGLGSASYAPILVAAHLAGAALPFLLERLERSGGTWMTRVRELYPIVLVGIYWTEVGPIRETFHDVSYDDIVLGAELAVFGSHIHETWLPAMPSVWFAEVMQFLYLLYYPIVFLTPAVLAFTGRHEAAKDVAFNVLLAYILCFVSFAVFPIDGPRYLMTPFEGEHMEGLLHRFAESLHSGGDQLGGAFPSTHVAGVTAMALLAWRWFSRPMAYAFWVGMLGVTLSAVYLQNHYAMDSVVGTLVGFLSFFVAAPLITRLVGRSSVGDP